MDIHTRNAKTWLDKRYSRDQDGVYYSHQPIYGYDSNSSEPNAILRLARTYSLLKTFEQLQFENFLDVGGGEGYLASLVNDLFGVPSITMDLSSEACLRAREVLGIPSIAADISVLPFQDKSFDLVLCSEVIEHLSQPVRALSEIKRVAKNYAVITTAEFCPLGEFERMLRVSTIDMDYPHAERNWFTKRDFQIIFGGEADFQSQMDSLGGKVDQYFSNLKLSKDQVEKSLDFLTRSNTIDAAHSGVIVLVPVNARENPLHRRSESPLGNERKQNMFHHLIEPYSEWAKAGSLDQTLDAALFDKLICVVCKSDVSLTDSALICNHCGAPYPIVDGVPQIFPKVDGLENNESGDGELIAYLSGGDQEHARRVADLIEKLHSERPVGKIPVLHKISENFFKDIMVHTPARISSSKDESDY